ncbi:hypothetical protein E2C01_013871 [Portunus trituberculatus]|uniref:Uncharacterized protein n=1 Tax=Portunus trituberculatus TaxID=210409 RepID=A0A5B7DI97_PORTR|nr:hypothetical protein [Portunus trituberculatus]
MGAGETMSQQECRQRLRPLSPEGHQGGPKASRPKLLPLGKGTSRRETALVPHLAAFPSSLSSLSSASCLADVFIKSPIFSFTALKFFLCAVRVRHLI